MRTTLVMLCSVASLAGAQLTKQPPGLAAGSQYRLAFITSTVRDAASDDIEDYNSFVQQTADAALIVGPGTLSGRQSSPR